MYALIEGVLCRCAVRVIRWLALVSLVALGACSPAVDQVFPTALPTFTATWTHTPSSTPAPPTATPTPDLTRQAALDALTSATPVFPTPRPEALFTATPSPIPVGALRIEYFVADVDSVEPGGSFRLFWSVRGVSQVTIYRLTAEGEREQQWQREATGTLEVTVTTREDDREVVQFTLVIGDATNQLEQRVTVSVACTVSANCPGTSGAPISLSLGGSAITSAAAQQSFERGLMVWVQTEGRIYVLFDDGQAPAWTSYVDEFRDGQPELDPSITSPNGLLQPVRGFGLVWRAQPTVRDRLGWATAPEVGYVAQLQGGSSEAGPVAYITSIDGAVFELAAGGTQWRRASALPDQPAPTPTP